MIKRLILTLAIFISFAIANNSLESKIAKLQTVPKEQRYKLMNQIKRELAKMNATQRRKALNKLKTTMHTSNSSTMHTHTHIQHDSKDISSHMQNSTEHLINRTHLHEQNNKPKKPHNPSTHNTPKTPGKHKNPGGNKKPIHQKDPHVK